MAKQTLRQPSITVTPEQYKTLSEQYTPKPTIVKNVLLAFIVGGIICALGQMMINFFISLGLGNTEASTAATAIMIFLGALLTGLGVYDEIGKIGGAGSIIPVTGFANSIVAPALEFKREGYILGMGAKLFVVAGPVLVFGIATSIAAGLVYLILH